MYALQKRSSTTAQSPYNQPAPPCTDEWAVLGNQAMIEQLGPGQTGPVASGGTAGGDPWWAAELPAGQDGLIAVQLQAEIAFYMSTLATAASLATDLLSGYLHAEDSLPWYRDSATRILSRSARQVGTALGLALVAAAPEGAIVAPFAGAFAMALGYGFQTGMGGVIDAVDKASGGGVEFTGVMKAEWLAATNLELLQSLNDAGSRAFDGEDVAELTAIRDMLAVAATDLSGYAGLVFDHMLQGWLLYGAEATRPTLPGDSERPGHAFTLNIAFSVDSEDAVAIEYAQLPGMPEESLGALRDLPLAGFHVVFQGIGRHAAGAAIRIGPSGDVRDASELGVGDAVFERLAPSFGARTADEARRSIRDWIFGNTLEGMSPGVPVTQ